MTLELLKSNIKLCNSKFGTQMKVPRTSNTHKSTVLVYSYVCLVNTFREWLTLVLILECLQASSSPPTFHWLLTTLTNTVSMLTLLWDSPAFVCRNVSPLATPLQPMTTVSTLQSHSTFITGTTGSVTMVIASKEMSEPRYLRMFGCRRRRRCWDNKGHMIRVWLWPLTQHTSYFLSWQQRLTVHW